MAAADTDAERQQRRRTQNADDARTVDAEDSFISVSSEQGIRWVELKRQLGATSRIRRNESLPSLQEDRTNYCNGTAIYGKYCLSCSQAESADWGVSDSRVGYLSPCMLYHLRILIDRRSDLVRARSRRYCMRRLVNLGA